MSMCHMGLVEAITFIWLTNPVYQFLTSVEK